MVELFSKPVKRPAIPAAVLSVAITVISTVIGKMSIFAFLFCIAAVIILFLIKRYKIMAVALVCAVISLNLTNTYYKIGVIRQYTDKTVSGNFVVTEDSLNGGKSSYMSVKYLSGDSLPYGTRLEPKIKGDYKFKAGEIISAEFSISDIPSSSRKRYYSEDIYAKSTLISFEKSGKTNAFYNSLGVIRRYIKAAYNYYANGDIAALLIAVTTGDKTYLSDKLYNKIVNTGVGHMIAVSGFHLAVLLGNAFLLINKLIKNRFARFIISFFAVLLLMGVCGFSKSVIRAGSMYIISAAAILFYRESDSLSSLAVSVSAVLLFSPFSVFSVAFNLSVISTFSLIYISPFLIRLFSVLYIFKFKVLREFLSIVINSLFAAVFSMPVLIRSFGRVSAVSVFANLFLNYIVTLLLLFGTLALVILPVFSPLAFILFKAAAFCSKSMIFIVDGLSQLPVVSLKLGNTAFAVSLIIIIIITLSVGYFGNRLKKGGTPLYVNGL